MLELYDFAESVCCQKVRLAIAELDIEGIKEHKILLDQGDQFEPAFLQLNPKGVVPVLVHNDRVVTESTIISEYLNLISSGPNLMPEDPYLYSRKQYWSMQVDRAIHNPHTTIISFVCALRFTFLDSLDTPEKIEEHLANVVDPVSRDMQRQGFQLGFDAPAFHRAVIAFDQLLSEMEETLQNYKWLAGADISLADLDLAPYVHRLDTLGLANFWQSKPHLKDWYGRLKERKSWKVAISEKHDQKWLDLMSNMADTSWKHVDHILNDSHS